MRVNDIRDKPLLLGAALCVVALVGAGGLWLGYQLVNGDGDEAVEEPRPEDEPLAIGDWVEVAGNSQCIASLSEPGQTTHQACLEQEPSSESSVGHKEGRHLIAKSAGPDFGVRCIGRCLGSAGSMRKTSSFIIGGHRPTLNAAICPMTC